MLCYRDRTYCIAECNNTTCPLRLTPKIEKEAEDFGLPICAADYTGGCAEFMEKTNGDNSTSN